ncbi:hypothetical protein ACLBV9_02460 [Staphylococcus succinus]|uniref:hypothetical protein n=1 Tax=Staphylococcus succinus TaxID=61015 RepID=UPI000938027E|nr:hypothetical protein [Staphylococcus succinus]MEB8209471.1 hypothetical protein [Staphylococcus succinus]PKI23120.1 hypothetical protein CW746_03560 [Staphylococcus succinus]RIN23223.1 hypothetical protein BU066_12735 [Staphylococcus succinus]RIN28630.1 hypothetical protein BU063_12910 [Staphylococcus succinus]
MKDNNTKDMGFLISTILNVFLLVGLIFIYQFDNLTLIIIYTVVMGINAIYLLVKTRNSWKDRDDI